MFALQLKRDLLEERLSCSDTTAALLASHLLQCEYLGWEVLGTGTGFLQLQGFMWGGLQLTWFLPHTPSDSRAYLGFATLPCGLTTLVSRSLQSD